MIGVAGKHVTSTVHFRRVCVTPEVDERAEIEAVLRRVPASYCRVPDWTLVKTDGDLQVFEGTAKLTANKLTDLNKLYTDIYALREKPRNGAVIDFVLQERKAELGFCSNYAKSEIWTTIRGQTLPCAAVELWLPDGTTTSVQLDEKGHWEFRLRIIQGKNWVYGVSRVAAGQQERERPVEKYFRVEVHTSRFEQLTKERFDELRRKEP